MCHRAGRARDLDAGGAESLAGLVDVRYADREVDVVRLAAIGLTLKEIAANLSVSAHTARHHLEHVYEKVGVSSRAGVTLFAVENGLIS